MNVLSNLNNVVEFESEYTGLTFKIDFKDKRLTNKLLHLFKKMKNIDKDIEEKVSLIEAIEDEFEKLLAGSDLEVEVLEDFKKDVDNVFGFNITEKMYGNTLQDVSCYTDLFDIILPFIKEVKEKEKTAFDAISAKYSLPVTPERADI